jgi:prepilin-type processing-associated H-X9-DG protein
MLAILHEDNHRRADVCGSKYDLPPNSWSCAAANPWDTGTALAAGNRYPGGVNCLMMDGSVKFITSIVAKET